MENEYKYHLFQYITREQSNQKSQKSHILGFSFSTS